MTRAGYRGSSAPTLVPVALHEGWIDRRSGSFRRFEQLYRHPRWKRAAYRAGWLLAGLAGGGR